jgi:hypothetical protein
MITFTPVIPHVNSLFAMLAVLWVCHKCALLCCTLGSEASNEMKCKNVLESSAKKTGIGNDSKCPSVADLADFQMQQKCLWYPFLVTTAFSSDAPSIQSIARLSDRYNSKHVCEVSCANVQMKHVPAQIAINRFKSQSPSSQAGLSRYLLRVSSQKREPCGTQDMPGDAPFYLSSQTSPSVDCQGNQGAGTLELCFCTAFRHIDNSF